MWKFIIQIPLLHRRELIVIVVCLLIFISALIFSSQLINPWRTFFIKKEIVRIETGIQQELDNISLQREQIIASGVFTNVIKRNNPLEILATAQIEATKRDLDFFVVTDKNGFVLARSHLPTQIGDNFFLTSAYGRIIAKDETKTVTTIERGPRVPLIFVSVSQVLDGGQPIGGITIGYSLYDSYADRFQKKYLKQGEQIIFYTPQEGIVGDSLNDKNKTQLIDTYFSLSSDIGTKNLVEHSKEVKIGNDYYIIHDIVFPGIEKSPGGMLILFPVSHKFYSLFLASSVIFLFFLIYYLSLFLLKFLNHHKHRLPILLFVSLIFFVVIYFATLIKLDNSAIEIKKLPYLIYNSTMKFDPESDVINQFSEKTIAIKVVTGGEAINAVSAVVNYDPKVVEVLDIITVNSFCDPSFFLEKEIIAKRGEVRITCGIPNPGFFGAVGTVAELLVQPLDFKSISLEFTKETQVLANDGLGTNVLRAVTNGYYQVIQQEFATPDIKNPIPIFSPSHPNSNRWYNNKNIKLSWPELLKGTYYYTLYNKENPSTKDKIFSTVRNYLDIVVSEDGIYDFNFWAKDAMNKSGPISNLKIMIDTTPPLSPKIQVSSNIIKRGDIVRLDFTSEDKLSGLQSGFYVKINEGVFLPVKPPFFIPFLESGEYPIVIRVFDKANNFSDSDIVIRVND